jgi:hypothetical protein
MNKYDYKLTIAGTKEFDNLQQFAESFDHKITAHPEICVYSHYRNGELFGYSDHCHFPVVYPAFHPKYTKPKDVIQVMDDWRKHYQMSNRMGYVGVPLIEGRPNFTEPIMQKLGLVKANRELYYPN